MAVAIEGAFGKDLLSGTMGVQATVSMLFGLVFRNSRWSAITHFLDEYQSHPKLCAFNLLQSNPIDHLSSRSPVRPDVERYPTCEHMSSCVSFGIAGPMMISGHTTQTTVQSTLYKTLEIVTRSFAKRLPQGSRQLGDLIYRMPAVP